MTTATVFVLGQHAFEIRDVDEDTQAALIGLTSHMWGEPAPLGHIELTPKPGVSLRISLRDIVAVEIDTTR